ncbi:metal-binding protein ZinT [Brucella gallinifaecis]|uniref:ZinT family metal-binding protein n=1 Tax=Brucella gallinifaecis TaxID=215590 RepID=UPI00235F3784|nr:metal-binding protein ZinT [Brucella gallinifaecis]
MLKTLAKLAVIGIFSAALPSNQAIAHETSKTGDKSAHAHSHSHSHDNDIAQGYFKNSQIRDRSLSDWEGDWQSVYPYLKDGTLEPVFAHKAKHGDKTAQQYHDYYNTGYKTDTNRIVIDGDKITFHDKENQASGIYASDGYEILNYDKGKRGVRYVFKKTSGDSSAPLYIQFSDHSIAPEKASHYHLYWGNDRAALLQELVNWPTYYPSSLSGKEIVEEMIAH